MRAGESPRMAQWNARRKIIAAFRASIELRRLATPTAWANRGAMLAKSSSCLWVISCRDLKSSTLRCSAFNFFAARAFSINKPPLCARRSGCVGVGTDAKAIVSCKSARPSGAGAAGDSGEQLTICPASTGAAGADAPTSRRPRGSAEDGCATDIAIVSSRSSIGSDRKSRTSGRGATSFKRSVRCGASAGMATDATQTKQRVRQRPCFMRTTQRNTHLAFKTFYVHQATHHLSSKAIVMKGFLQRKVYHQTFNEA